MDKKKRISIIIFIIGLAALIGGGVFFALDFFKKPDISDADFLVSAHTWFEQDAPSVIWTFNEIGKGSLTTNNHLNDYDFIWSIEDDTIKIETSWLYLLENEYTYTLDQESQTLTLTAKDSETTYTFTTTPSSTVDNSPNDEPVPEDEPAEPQS